MSLLRRPDHVESREAFVAYIDEMRGSLVEALANPTVPFRPAVDDRGNEWRNTTLSDFIDSMLAWMRDSGWSVVEPEISVLWAPFGTMIPGEVDGDEADLHKYLAGVREAADAFDHSYWSAAAQALGAGRHASA